MLIQTAIASDYSLSESYVVAILKHDCETPNRATLKGRTCLQSSFLLLRAFARILIHGVLRGFEQKDLVVSINAGTQYRPQNTIILTPEEDFVKLPFRLDVGGQVS